LSVATFLHKASADGVDTRKEHNNPEQSVPNKRVY